MAPKRKTREGEEGGGSSENTRVTRQMVAATRRMTRSASNAAGSPKLVSLPMSTSSPRKKAKTTTSKEEVKGKGKTKEEASGEVEVKVEAREKVKGKGKAKMEEASEEVEVKEEEREKVKGKGKAKMEEEASEEVEVKEEAREKVEGKGKEKVGETEKDENLNKTITIERCTQCSSFKTRALEVKVGLEDAVPGINVVINPNKPRRGCFEVREEGGETFVSLLEMKRPFKPMKELDMPKVISDIVDKIK